MFEALAARTVPRLAGCSLAAMATLGSSLGPAPPEALAQRAPVNVLVTSASVDDRRMQNAVSDSATDIRNAIRDADSDNLAVVLMSHAADIVVTVTDRYQREITLPNYAIGQVGCCAVVEFEVAVGDRSYRFLVADPLYWREAAKAAGARIRNLADSHYYQLKNLPFPEPATPGGVPADIRAHIEMLDGNSAERATAALALGNMGERAAVAASALVEKLRDDDTVNLMDDWRIPDFRASTVGAEAARALAQAGVIGPLVQGLRSDHDDTRYNVVVGLANSTYPGADEMLIEATRDEESRIRRAAVAGLGFVPSVTWPRFLHPDVSKPDVRPQDPAAIDALIAALADRDTRVREYSAEGLGNRRDLRSIEPLIEVLDDRGSVKRAAALSLRRLTDYDLGEDQSLWRDWWRDSGASFSPSWAQPTVPEPTAPTAEPTATREPTPTTSEPMPTTREPSTQARQQEPATAQGAEGSITPALVALLAARSPAFADGDRSLPETARMAPIPGTGAYYAEITWEEGGERRSAIVTVGPVSVDPEAFYLSRVGGFGMRDYFEGSTIDDVIAALETALNLGRQRRTMADMRNVATANGTMRVDTGRYASNLADLAPTYMQTAPETDAWGNPWQYIAAGDSYTLVSHGSDGAPGPAPPTEWRGAPFEADLVLTDGAFLEAPESSTGPAQGGILAQQVLGPWMRVANRDQDLQADTLANMRALVSANVMLKAMTGTFAARLEDLRTGDYATTAATTDGWGNPWVYTTDGASFTLISYGCDGQPGPAPPANWEGLPCEPDIIVRDGEFVQAPERR